MRPLVQRSPVGPSSFETALRPSRRPFAGAQDLLRMSEWCDRMWARAPRDERDGAMRWDQDLLRMSESSVHPALILGCA